MNKYLKGCLVIFGIGLVLIFALVAWYFWRKKANKQQAEADEVKFSKICDSAPLISEQPTISLVDFKSEELKQIHFYIIRRGKAVSDTLISPQSEEVNQFVSIQIPFASFSKSDTIVVATGGKNNRFFQLTGFHHYAYLHYGMMGYLGSYDCRVDEQNFLVNGKRTEGQLIKKMGLTNLPYTLLSKR